VLGRTPAGCGFRYECTGAFGASSADCFRSARRPPRARHAPIPEREPHALAERQPGPQPAGEVDQRLYHPDQTLPFIYNIHAVMRTLQRILNPGGVVLATVGGITQIQPKWGNTANNHLLNTALMQLCSTLFGNSELSLRLPNVLAHAVYLACSLA